MTSTSAGYSSHGGVNGYEQVPQELRSCDTWGLWRYVNIPGKHKPAKIPFTVRGSRADTTDPSKWVSFTRALEVYNNGGGYDGLGFLLTRENVYVGIDIDNCVQDGVVADWAREIINRYGSYTEFSPSGRGVKIFLASKWRPGPGAKQGLKRSNIELYFSERYFTVTGKHVPDTPQLINDCSDLIQSLYFELIGSNELAVAGKLDINREELPDGFLSEIRKRDARLADRIESEQGAMQSGAEVVDQLYGRADLHVDRNRNDMYIANWLLGHGYSPGIALSVLTHPKWFSGSKSREQGKGYAERTITNAARAISERRRKLPDAQKLRTEQGNAEMLIENYGANLRYCDGKHGWLIWNGHYWSADETYLVHQYLHASLRTMVAKRPDDDATLKWAVASQKYRIQHDSLQIAKTLEGVSMPMEVFDSLAYTRMKLPVENGVIDLETGELSPHDRMYYFTRICPVRYDPSATCPRWLEALEQWLPDVELRTFIRRAAGYTLTGDTSEQVIFFLYGAGHNGKSTFIQVMQGILGQFCKRIPTEAVATQKHGSVGTLREQAAARLQGARMGVTSEVDRNATLAEGFLKDFTGGGSISTKVLYKDIGETQPTAKLFFDANHRPRVFAFTDDAHADLDAFWRRFREIPWMTQVPPEKRVKDYHRILLAEEASGILNWALEGCIDWQQHGLPAPEAVKQANREYRNEMDLLKPFIDEWLEEVTDGSKATITKRELHSAYRRYCQEEGEHPVTSKELIRRLQERGLKFGKRDGYELLIGFKLKKDPSEYEL